jgi:hypothetical protein
VQYVVDLQQFWALLTPLFLIGGGFVLGALVGLSLIATAYSALSEE